MAVDFDALTGAAVLKAFGAEGRVLYRPKTQPFFTVDGVFDRYQIEAMGEDGAAFSIKKTTLGVRAADFPRGVVPAAGDRAQILGLSFVVNTADPDGLGWIALQLSLDGSTNP